MDTSLNDVTSFPCNAYVYVYGSLSVGRVCTVEHCECMYMDVWFGSVVCWVCV